MATSNKLKEENTKLKEENTKLRQLVYGTNRFQGSNEDEMVLLKLRDYSTEIMARVKINADGYKTYYVMHGSGRCVTYGDSGVEWVKPLKVC